MNRSSLIEAFGGEHQEALAWLNRLDEALDKVAAVGEFTGETRAVVHGFSDFLKKALLTHFHLEEVALFPVLGQVVGTDSGPIAVMLVEHKDIERDQQVIERGLEDATPDVRQVLSAGRNVIAVLSQHIHKEDNVLFPMAYRFLNEAQLAEVDRLAKEDAAIKPVAWEH